METACRHQHWYTDRTEFTTVLSSLYRFRSRAHVEPTFVSKQTKNFFRPASHEIRWNGLLINFIIIMKYVMFEKQMLHFTFTNKFCYR